MRNNALHKIIVEDIDEIISAALPWENFSGKTILISGAAGFLPSYLVHTILRLNELKYLTRPAKIIAIVRNKASAEIKFANYLERNDFELIVQDINKQPFPTLKQDIHYIIHAASQASPKYYGSDPVGTLAANVFGTSNLLKLAQTNPIECFLYFSSGEVYGQLSGEVDKANETTYGYIDPLNVRSCYAQSKRMGETMCIAWQHQFGVPVKIVRPFHTYGPGMQLDDGRVFADFVADVVHSRNIVMKSNGDAIRAFCYLVDATIGFFTVLFRGGTGEAYNVSNDKAIISILELAEIVAKIFPQKNLKVIKKENDIKAAYMKSSIQKNAADITKLGNLGWRPKYSVANGFKRTLLSFNTY